MTVAWRHLKSIFQTYEVVERLLKISYLSRQCAAVRTNFLEMREPPHHKALVLEGFVMIATCHGGVVAASVRLGTKEAPGKSFDWSKVVSSVSESNILQNPD